MRWWEPPVTELPPPGGWQYRARVAWPDVDTTTALPAGWAWDGTEYGVVNSDGTANDPRRVAVRRGGGLVSPVCGSSDALADAAAEAFELLRPGHNHRSRLRVYVRLPGLSLHLDALKRIAVGSREMAGLFDRIDPLDVLTSDQPDRAAARMAEDYKSAMVWQRHHLIPRRRHERRAGARTLRELLAAEAPEGRGGRPDFRLAGVEALNLRGVPRGDWLEFRCFAAPLDPGELKAAAAFAGLWLHCSIAGTDPMAAVNILGPHLPRQHRFDAWLERRWNETTSRAPKGFRYAHGRWWHQGR